MKLPVAVLIPCRNSMALLPSHLDSMAPWIGDVEEVVVVDSDSTDGTLEFLQDRLCHPRLKILSHPPGLYESWNFGISQVAAEFVYISTVGDSILASGLEHLAGVAQKSVADVVVSKPKFVDEGGAPLTEEKWTIDHVINLLKIDRPLLLTPEEQFVFAVSHFWSALLGSSASNLYRSECLRRHPFPVDYGFSGDGAWGIMNAFCVRVAVTPERFSTFRRHRKSYPTDRYEVELLATRLVEAGKQSLARVTAEDGALRARSRELDFDGLIEAIEHQLIHQRELELYRRRKTPWIFQPTAWRTRWLRRVARQTVDRIRSMAEDRFRAERGSRQPGQ